MALERGTGARGLRAILEEVLLNTMYDVPGKGDVAKVVITEQAVKEKAAPLVVMRGNTRTPRQRRAAS
jgi:ATP-dependent Clp protease ATP-binding subunit ClpX